MQGEVTVIQEDSGFEWNSNTQSRIAKSCCGTLKTRVESVLYFVTNKDPTEAQKSNFGLITMAKALGLFLPKRCMKQVEMLAEHWVFD